MIWNTEETNHLPGGKWLNRLLFMLALGGLALNLLLWFRSMIDGGIVGCGGGSACAELLSSRWSQVFGMPITAFGTLIYLALMVSLSLTNRPLINPILGVILGAAAWFVFVQMVLLGRYCPWCMATHGIGVCVAVLGLQREIKADDTESVWMTAGGIATSVMLGLGFLQYYGPVTDTSRMDDVQGLSAAESPEIYSRGDGRKVVFADRQRTYNVSLLPHLGPEDAKCVMVEYFDYGCPSCRVMRGFLNALMAKHPADICLVILPVPLERSCNFSLSEKDEEFPGSCKLTKLALVLWRTHPDKFAKFHHSLLDGASTDEASAKVLELMAPSEMFAAMRDPWIEELIQANVNDYAAFSVSTKKLPKLLITGTRILHGLPSGEEDFIRVMEKELALGGVGPK